MQFLFVLTIIMVAMASNWVRRRFFELFYYTHHLSIVLFIAALIHAWSLWYYLSGPLVLWCFDRLLRFVNGTSPMRLGGN